MPALHFVAKQQTISEADAEYVLSDGEPDRTGDVIEAKGWEIGAFSPIALFNHNRDAVIGKWENVKVKAGKLVGKLVLADPGTSPIVDMVRAFIRQGILETVSVGFRPLESEPMDPKEPWGALRFTKQELLEASIVAVPANPRARRIAKQYLSDAETDRLFAKPGAMQVKAVASANVAKLGATQPHSRGTPMPAKISEGITAKKNRIVAIKDELAAIAKRAEDNDFDLSDEDADAQDALAAELDTNQRQLQRLESLEKNLAGSVRVDDDDPANERRSAGELITYERVEGTNEFRQPSAAEEREVSPIRMAARNARGYDLLVRMALIGFVSHIKHQDPVQVLNERYGKTKHFRDLEVVVKAVSAPAMTNVVGWAQELVGANVRALLDTIKPVSVYPRIAARGTELSFDGRNPIILPYRQYGSTVHAGASTDYDKRLAGAFVGEGSPIPVRQGLFRSLTLNPYKMGVISAFTREMAFASTPAIEQIIREAIAEDTAWVLDMATFSSTAAIPGVRPAGLFNGVTPLTPAAAGAGAAIADIKALVGAVIGAGGGRSVVLIMNPLQAMDLSFMTDGGVFLFRDEIARGTLMGVSLITSTTVPVGDVYCMDAGEFASATGDPVFDVSDQATLHMDDGTYPADFTAPSVKPIVSGADPGTIANPVRSLWQTASIAVRMLMNVSWGMRRSGMIAVMHGVTW